MSTSSSLSRVIQSLNARLYRGKHIDSKDTILIVGSPRSGTTWVMNILSTLSGYTYVFEPLNPIWFPESFEIGFRSRTYIPPDSTWPQGQQYLEYIFEGKSARLPIKDNPLADVLQGFSPSTFIKYLFNDKLIVKSVNMNRMLPWVARQFRLRGIVCIVRHPCAVVASQLKTGLCGYHTTTPPYIDVFPTKATLLDEVKEIDGLSTNVINVVNAVSTQEEILAAVWCLDNYNVLSHPTSNRWNLVVYEHLLRQKDGLERLFSTLGQRTVPSMGFHRYRKPSVVTTKESKWDLRRPDCHLSQWKTSLSEKQIERILRIVSAFDIRLYSHDVEPNDTAFKA